MPGRSDLVRKSEHGYDTCAFVTAQGFRSRVTMIAVQSKMARAATGLGIRDLASAAGVSPDTISRLERGETLAPRTLAAIRTALEAAGVEFTNGDAPGVLLRKVGAGR